MEKLMEGKTSIIIAHRLSTVLSVDRIYYIDNGQILESGSHDMLISKEGGLYRELAQYQFKIPVETNQLLELEDGEIEKGSLSEQT